MVGEPARIEPSEPDPGGAASTVRRRGSPAPLRRRWLAVVLAALATLLVTAALEAFIHDRIERTITMQARNVVQSALDAATRTLELTLTAAQRAAVEAASDPNLVAGARACGERQVECAIVERTLHSYVRAGGFARGRFVSPDKTVLVAAPAVETEPLSPELFDLGARQPSGRAARGPATRHAGRPVLPVVTAVRAGEGSPLGVLVLDLPLDPIDRVMRATRVGRSGETYVFDRQARLLTESRFVSQLQRAGLLAPDQDSAVLVLELRDPGVDLTQGERAPLPRARQPLTRMAASALAGRAGNDVTGYRDYRGVQVIGAWRPLAEHDLAIATEVDVADAYRSLHTLQRLFTVLLVLLALASCAALVVVLVNARLRERTEAAERRAERFGQYVLERKLGEGGMGVVYLAQHALLRRKAAVKLLRPDRVSAEALAQFEREVQVTSTLTHPNTVEVYDFGRTDAGAFYYVMEYLVGVDLQRLVLAFGPLPQARVIHFLRQLCGSLAEAHGAGVVHRDIKPANLFACTRGGLADTLKVLDFGIVQVGAAEPLREGEPFAGTPEYMAPELFESAVEATPQSDLYAVGVVAYFLLTGAPPFSGSETRELCFAHLTQTPEPIALPRGEALDPVLGSAVRACLAKHASARPASATSLGQWLESSAIARAWTQTEARTWWAEHAEPIVGLRATLPPGSRRSLVLPLRTPPAQ